MKNTDLRHQWAMAAHEEDIEIYREPYWGLDGGHKYKYTRNQARYRFADDMIKEGEK